MKEKKGIGSTAETHLTGQYAEAVDVQLLKLLVACMLNKVIALAGLDVLQVHTLEKGIVFKAASLFSRRPELKVCAVPGREEGAAASRSQEPILNKVTGSKVVSSEVNAALFDFSPARHNSEVLKNQDGGVEVHATITKEKCHLGTVSSMLTKFQGVQCGREVFRFHKSSQPLPIHHLYSPSWVCCPPRLHAELVERRHGRSALVPVSPHDTRCIN
mmetsp:Transcript_22012/g.50300  ORF Transcript_22012/g.50300 Transcript_22012/m.50300 type:complete len:216 (-) Transcript_22012:879-1526(-)